MPNKVTKKTETKKAAAPRKKRTSPPVEEPSSVLSANGAPSEERVRARAYEISRAGTNGNDPVADWFQAERELRTGA